MQQVDECPEYVREDTDTPWAALLDHPACRNQGKQGFDLRISPELSCAAGWKWKNLVAHGGKTRRNNHGVRHVLRNKYGPTAFSHLLQRKAWWGRSCGFCSLPRFRAPQTASLVSAATPGTPRCRPSFLGFYERARPRCGPCTRQV